eukprot:scaffold674_cov51-Phaeocystis_antarctica.AAC.2
MARHPRPTIRVGWHRWGAMRGSLWVDPAPRSQISSMNEIWLTRPGAPGKASGWSPERLRRAPSPWRMADCSAFVTSLRRGAEPAGLPSRTQNYASPPPAASQHAAEGRTAECAAQRQGERPAPQPGCDLSKEGDLDARTG